MYPCLRSMDSKVAKYNIHPVIEEGSRMRGNKVPQATGPGGQGQSRLHKCVEE